MIKMLGDVKDVFKAKVIGLKRWVRCRLVPDARQWWKFWSTQLIALGTTLVSFAPDIHSWVVYFMTSYTQLPVSVQEAFDPSIIQMVGLFVIILSIPAKLFKQKNIDGEVE